MVVTGTERRQGAGNGNGPQRVFLTIIGRSIGAAVAGGSLSQQILRSAITPLPIRPVAPPLGRGHSHDHHGSREQVMPDTAHNLLTSLSEALDECVRLARPRGYKHFHARAPAALGNALAQGRRGRL
jgi:hypothetical protein